MLRLGLQSALNVGFFRGGMRNNEKTRLMPQIRFLPALKLKTYNWQPKTFLFVRWVRRAHVHVAQITQHGPIFFAHAAREIRVI